MAIQKGCPDTFEFVDVFIHLIDQEGGFAGFEADDPNRVQGLLLLIFPLLKGDLERRSTLDPVDGQGLVEPFLVHLVSRQKRVLLLVDDQDIRVNFAKQLDRAVQQSVSKTNLEQHEEQGEGDSAHRRDKATSLVDEQPEREGNCFEKIGHQKSSAGSAR